MKREFQFPDLGEGIEEGQIVKWLVKEGDQVKEHQAVGEVETEKAVAEIPSPYSGIIIKINFKEGESVKVGEVLFVVDDGQEDFLQKETLSKKSVKPIMKPAGAVGYLEEAPDEITESKPSVVSTPSKKELSVLATPSVRKLAIELGVDLVKIIPTGKDGRITEEDVKKSVKSQIVVKKKYDLWGYIDRVPLKGLRKTIAKHMIEAVKHAPQVTIMDELDVTELVKTREKESQKAERTGVKLTFLPFIMKSLIPAMKEFPLLNATLEEETEEIIVKKYYNFGVAVDVNGQGLIVPVLKGVDLKNIFDIAKEVQELAQKARERKLDIQDLKGGTFTITNFGSLGSYFATPILNYPEVAILGIGRMKEKPIVKDGKIEIKPMMPLSLTFDHRVLDGALAIRFLNSLMKNLQDPQKFLI
ncbi:MAG: dihydrolipoamide acetyltransferase family protein [Patescibacteria group bacterium]